MQGSLGLCLVLGSLWDFSDVDIWQPLRKWKDSQDVDVHKYGLSQVKLTRGPPPQERDFSMSGIDDYGIHSSTGYWIQRLATSMGQVFQAKLSQHDVTRGQWAALGALEQGDASTPREIAQFLGLDPSAVTRLLDRLEVKGLLVRRQHPADRRSVALALTAKGKSLVPKLAACSLETNETFLMGVNQKDAASLVRIVKKMLDTAEGPLQEL